MLECVVNISEGRRPEIVRAVAEACGPVLLDVHTDPDHNRSVLTLAGPVDAVAEAALALARAAIERIDISAHSGVHPRLGAVDVVPFVPLAPDGLPVARAAAAEAAPGGAGSGRAGAGGAGSGRAGAGGAEPGRAGAGGAGPGPPGVGLEQAGAVAQAWGAQVADELAVPVFFYGAADPAERSLPDVRRSAFRDRAPDFGPGEPHPTAGAIAVGARPVLVAINCELAAGDGGIEGDLAVAREVARAVRERDGGLPGVRALGFALASKGRAQVSMNLTDLEATGVEAACEAVCRAAVERGGEVTGVELVGLLPAAELDRCSGEFLTWSGLSPERTIEARVRAAGSST